MSSIADDLPPASQNDSTHLRRHEPIKTEDRINSIDVLRGVAVLGILFINIWIFALPELAYIDTTAPGGDAKLNLTSWLLCEILFEGKMRALLSLLFGAGVVMLTTRIEASGGAADVTDIYYRRCIWLLVFGVAQSYLLNWVADFIYVYALAGLPLFPFRKMRAEGLLLVGLLLFLVLAPGRIAWNGPSESVRSVAAANNNESMQPADANQTAERRRIGLWIFAPAQQPIEEIIEIQRSDYLTIFNNTSRTVGWFQSRLFYTRYLWDVAGMMFIGMALAKMGLFLPDQPRRVCLLLIIVGYGIGLPLSVDLASRLIPWRRSSIICCSVFTPVR